MTTSPLPGPEGRLLPEMPAGKRSILVTGAASPIGERLVRRLLANPSVARVVAIDLPPIEQALPFERPSNLSYFSVDLRKHRQIHRILFGPALEFQVDTIIDAAHHMNAWDQGRSVWALNVQATRELLDMAERHPTVKRYIYRSFAEVYQIQADLPVLIEEDHPINLAPGAPEWIRDRVEADILVCTRVGLSRLHTMVLRFAECLAPGTGSQLYDYLESPIAFKPFGFNPMINVMTVQDMIRAMELAVFCPAQGVFNIPGKDTLPLKRAIMRWGRIAIPVSGAWLSPFYRLRGRWTGHEFRYGMNRRRFHYSGILDGTRARRVLGYEPEHPVEWPVETE